MRFAPLLSLLAFALCLAPVTRAADTGFVATLTAEQAGAAGLTRLTAAQRDALNALVAREVALARQGNVRSFAGTFVSRRKPAELAEAGLDRLTSDEQERLNRFVEAALAAGPARPEPRQLKPSEVAARERLQVHGGFSLAYGWGGGGTYRAASVYTDIYDPETGMALSVALGEANGSGAWFRGPCACAGPGLFRLDGLHGDFGGFRRH